MPAQINAMTIAKLARAAEVGVETVRYYQRRGLMAVPGPAGKSAFRHYDASHLQTLRFIRRAQSAGFTLEEIKELLALDRTRDRARVRMLAGARLKALEQQSRELEEARAGLQRLLGACQGSNRGPCPIIEAFSPEPVACPSQPERSAPVAARAGSSPPAARNLSISARNPKHGRS